MSVYFARCQQYVKVGWSRDPETRVQWLLLGNCAKPDDLSQYGGYEAELIRHVEGDYWDEQRAHAALADFRVAGEWFIAEHALLAWVDSLTGNEFPPLAREGGEWCDPRADAHLELDRLAAASVFAGMDLVRARSR